MVRQNSPQTWNEWIEEYSQSEQMIAVNNPGSSFNINIILLMFLLVEKLKVADAGRVRTMPTVENFLTAPNAYSQVEQWWNEWLKESEIPNKESAIKIPLPFRALYNQMIFAFKKKLEMYSLPDDV